MKAAYFNPVSGAAGDMILAAFIDAGLAVEKLSSALAPLPLQGYRLQAEKARQGPVQGTRLSVVVTSPQPRLHRLREILGLIQAGPLPAGVVERSLAIFRRLGEAEARVHGTSPEAVEFHEVGAADAVVEVVGAVLALEELGIEAVYSSPFNVGGGTVATEQGGLPVPAPAVMELLARSGAPFRPGYGDEGELLTPTGAAILTALASFQRPLLQVERTGYGVGHRHNPRQANVLPLTLGQALAPLPQRELLLLETNIDDSTPQLLSYVMEKLLEGGALDVWFTPIYMKKNRPAALLSALLPPEAEAAVVATVLRETTTLGLRLTPVARYEAEREVVEFSSSLGMVRLKVKKRGGQAVGLSPEYEDCRRLAQQHRLPLQEIFQIVLSEAGQGLDRRRIP